MLELSEASGPVSPPLLGINIGRQLLNTVGRPAAHCEIKIVDATGRVVPVGENVYPREVEEFLYRHPGIQDVQVFGIPDAKYGELVCAWIRWRPGAALGADDVKAFCRDQITHFKIPTHIRFVEEFPMTVTGKIQKFRMREQMIEELQP